MAAFRRASGAAVVDSLVKHDSSSYACAQRGVKDATITGPSAPDGFGKRRGVSVVVHARRNPKNMLHRSSERAVMPTRQVEWITHNTATQIAGTHPAATNPCHHLH